MRRNQVITALGLVGVAVLRLSLRLGWFLCVAVAIAFIFSGSALAQGDASYYFVTYFSRSEERRVESDWSSDVCSSDLPVLEAGMVSLCGCGHCFYLLRKCLGAG